jgi:DNA invertase Pin-like site-specific DNA recombinase
VEPYCHREGMDGTTPYGRAMLNMASVFAELERDLIRDRVMAGLARVKAEGKQLGRPPVAAKVQDRVRKLRAEGMPFRRIATECKIAVSTVQNILAAA